VAAIAIGAATVAIWVYLLLLRGGFWRMRSEPALAAAATPAAKVTAVIPARDEAAVIGPVLRSILAQDYPGALDIVIVDDESGDGTADVARAAAAAAGAEARVRVLRGTPPPPGWTGKLWALRQGIEAARRHSPDYLLLTDADIVHAPRNLRELIARARAERRDLVSLMVRLNCRSLPEQLLIPAFVFFFSMLYPPRWVADPSRRTSAAAGGCMLIRAEILDRIGGIDAIRGEIIDDCALSRRVKQAGGRVWLGLATDTVSLREYRSWRPLWDMIARCAFAQLGYSAVVLALTLLLLTIAYLAPPLLLLSTDAHAAALGAIAWALMSLMFLPIVRRYAAPRLTALLLPAICVFYAAATVASAIMFWRGRGGRWKGRFQASPR
jgi:hopene-associated glycosyltransferase HpnB